MLLDRGTRALDELLAAPAGAAYTDDRRIEVTPAHEGLQGRKDLLEGQISGGTEEYEGVGFLRGCSLLRHRRLLVPDARRIPGASPRVCDWRNRPRRARYSVRTAPSPAPAPARRRPPLSARSSALPPNR